MIKWAWRFEEGLLEEVTFYSNQSCKERSRCEHFQAEETIYLIVERR